MSRRRKPVEPTLPTGWTVSDEVRVNGRILRPGVEFRAVEYGTPDEGRRRLVRVRFTRYVETPTSAWVEGFDTNRHFRAFRLERIVRVHSLSRLRAA